MRQYIAIDYFERQIDNVKKVSKLNYGDSAISVHDVGRQTTKKTVFDF